MCTCSCSSWLGRTLFTLDLDRSIFQRRAIYPMSDQDDYSHCPFLGSPFNINVMDTQRVVVFGKGLGSIPVNVPTSFTIVTQNAGVGELKCVIKGRVAVLIL